MSPPPYFTYQTSLALLLLGGATALSKPGTERGSALTVLFSGSMGMASWPEGLTCTLELDSRLAGRCLLLTLSSNKAIFRITS